jgi:Heparinase II/III-like protein/Heparinase II/III N-terminus
MSSRVAQLKKLRGKSLKEIRVRSRQQFAKLNERVLGRGLAEMNDGALLNEINPASRNGNGEGSAMLILERIRSSTTSASRSSTGLPFFPSLARREEVTTIIKNHFPDERVALLERAERAIRGRFDLLGFSNLSFGDPIDWHLDPTTGRRTPLVHWSKINYLDPDVAGDKKVIWELNRHAHFVTLGQAYWLTGDERFAEAFVAQASSWIDANPPKLGINWASSLELSFRAIAWLWALHLFADSDRLTSKFISRFFKYLVAQGRHIESYLSHYFSPNTHLTGEALGLFYLGAALPELERARRWRDKGLGVLLEKLPQHIRGDGVYFEQSSYYHRYTVDFYTHLFVLARAANVSLPGEVEHRLSSALDHLMFITRPDGASPLCGDDDGGRLLTLNTRPADDFRDTLATGAALFGRSDWKFVAGEAAVETLWLLGPEAVGRYDGIEASSPAARSRAFDQSGYFVMRDGWSEQSSYVLADCGPHGSHTCAHAHADALAFEFAAEGKTWLIDPGTFTYTGDADLRDQFRTSDAHNTATVDGQSQSVPSGPFAWKHIAQSRAHQFVVEAAFDYFEGSHDGYERFADPVTHTRSLLFLKKDEACELPPFLIVRDQFNARKRHRYALRYHLATGSSATARDNEANASDAEGRALSINVFGESGPKARIEEGWVSRCYGQRELAPVALFEAEDEGPQQFVSFIVPQNTCRGGPPWPTLVEEEARAAQHGGAATEGRPYRAYSVSAGESRDIVLIAEQSNGLKHDLLTATGSMAWARFIDGGFRRGCLIGGRSYRVPRCLVLDAPADIGSCAIGIDNDQIEISIHGATRFDLSLGNAPSRIVVNNSGFDLPPGSQTVAFALEASGWKLAGKD